MLAAIPVLGIAVSAAAWAVLSSGTGEDEPGALAESIEPAAAPGDSTPSATPAEPTPSRFDRRWLPRRTRCIVSLRLSEIPEQELMDQALEAVEPVWGPTAGSVLETFGLKLRSVRRLTWAACDLAAWRDQAVVLIELEDGQTTAALRGAGEPVKLELAGVACRRLPKASWPHPFAVLDERTLLTGPESLLAELAQAPARLASGPIEKLVKAATWDGHFVLLDLAAARQAGWPLPTQWLDVWPAGRESWRTVCEVPQGLGILLRASPQPTTAVALVCDGETAADKVRGALDQFVPAARASVDALTSALAKKVQAGRLRADVADRYETFLKHGKAALQAARWEVAEAAVWVRLDWQDRLPAMTAAALDSPAALRADWLEAGLAVDEANYRRVLAGLGAHAKAEGKFPPGAGGGALLPASTRLSWIALSLPYLDHRDWRKELDPAYSWNSPQNRSVAQRPLDAVINPLLAERTTDAGFPVTHYVGVAGVGADAGDLPADDPRAGVFGFARAARPDDIPDGASNTLAVLGVTRDLGPWAAGGPATVRALTRRPYVNGPDGFGSGQPDGMLAGMADGSVRFLSKDADPQVLEQLATVRGGERPAVALPEARPTLLTQAAPAAAAKPAAATAKPVAVTAAKPEKPSPKTAASALKPAAKRPPAKGTDEDDVPDGAPRVDPAARLAERVPDIRFDNTPLVDAVRLLSQMSTLPVTFDLDAMAEVGAGLRDPVTVSVADASMGDVFQAVLATRKLVLVVEKDQVLVTCPQKLRAALRREKYDVAALASSADARGELADRIRTLVVPEAWREDGGSGTIAAAENGLDATQTETVHYQIRAFLEKLRAARENRQGTAADKLVLATRFDRVRARLRQPVTVNFPEPTPLVRILADLEEVGKTTIVVDWIALADAGVLPDAKATLKVNDQALSEAIVELLQPLGVTYRLAGSDVFEITTRKAVAARLELEFYPIGAILEKGQTVEAVMERIKGQVAGATWSDAGGPGLVVFDKPSGCLMVLQSQPVQVKIQILLAKLASELGAASAGTGGPPGTARRR